MNAKELRDAVEAWCDENGHGISYDGGRHVMPEAVDEFLAPELIDKTVYVLEREKAGQHIALLDFDEWSALSRALSLPELTFDDAMTISKYMWEGYDAEALELGIRTEMPSVPANANEGEAIRVLLDLPEMTLDHETKINALLRDNYGKSPLDLVKKDEPVKQKQQVERD